MSETLMSDPEIAAAQDRVGELVGVANAAAAALCAEVAEIIEREGWTDLLFAIRSPEHYVSWRTGFSSRHARQITTIARRWGELPQCQALFEAGSIGEDKMAMVARLVPSERDAEVARQATVMSFAQLAKVCRCVPKDPPSAPQREPSVTFYEDDERNEFLLRANTDLDTGAVITKGLEAARDDLFRMRFPESPDGSVARDGVTWVEALEHLAELGLRALDPGVRGGGRPSDRYQVFLHLDARDAQRPVVSTLHLGPVIRDALSRHLTCDSTVAPVVYDGDHLVGVFPKERIVNDRLRRTIEQRDGGCRVPACGQTRWVQVHHLAHWEHGGLTVPANLCCLCPFHHRMHHAGLLDIQGDPETPDGLTFYDEHGRSLNPPLIPPTTDPPNRPPEHLGLPTPHFVNPDGGRVDWGCFWWNDLSSSAN